jgi:membrane-bound inhibitor of C-type lysozyme
MNLYRATLLLLSFASLGANAAIAASPAPAAAPAVPAAPAVVVGPATPEPEAPLPAATSSLIINLGTTGDFERKTVKYGCQGDVDSIAVDYINAAPNYLALIPLEGSTLVFNTVLAASGAKYAAGKYVWWNKGTDADLYDLTQGANAKPVLHCSEINDTP